MHSQCGRFETGCWQAEGVDLSSRVDYGGKNGVLLSPPTMTSSERKTDSIARDIDNIKLLLERPELPAPDTNDSTIAAAHPASDLNLS